MNEKLIEYIKQFDGVTTVTQIYCEDENTILLEIEFINTETANDRNNNAL